MFGSNLMSDASRYGSELSSDASKYIAEYKASHPDTMFGVLRRSIDDINTIIGNILSGSSNSAKRNSAPSGSGNKF